MAGGIESGLRAVRRELCRPTGSGDRRYSPIVIQPGDPIDPIQRRLGDKVLLSIEMKAGDWRNRSVMLLVNRPS